jgi:amino acid transporter
VAGLFADAGASLVPAIGTLGGRALFIGVIFAAVAWINVRGVKQGTWLNVVLTVAKLVPLALLLVGGLLAADGANLRWEHGVPAMSDLARASVILVFAYAGVESALVPSGEVRDSARTVPRAVFLAMGIVTLLYVGLQLSAQGVLGAALPGSATPLADAAGRVFGAWGVLMISAGFMISAFGYLSGMMLAVPRALFAFGRDGILPRQVAAVHPRFHTPWIAIIVQSTLCWALAVLNSFETLAIIANVSAALVYIGCAAAAWKLSRGPAASADSFRIPGGALVPVLAILALTFLLSAVTVREWSVLVIVLAVASVLYVAARRNSPRV